MTSLLTFIQGYFYMESSDHKTLTTLAKDTSWVKVRDGVYQTTNLKAAAGFTQYSDVKTKRIFNRVFSRHYSLPSQPLPPFLDPHQIEGVKWILGRSRSYLAHAPGAGKTAQAVVASIYAKSFGQTLCIVPPDLTRQWEREILKFTEFADIYPAIGIVPTSDKQHNTAWRSDFIICPDSMLTKPWVYEKLLELNKMFVAVDEGSRFKDPLALRSIAFYGGVHVSKSKNTKYPGLFRDARHTVFMDGSPMPNRPMELWAPTYALHPEAIDCMDQRTFGFRYCGAQINERGEYIFNQSSNEEELKRKLRRDFMHVVGEDELDHPERLRSLLFLNEDVRTNEMKSWERKHLATLKFSDLDEDMNQGQIASYRKELGLRKVPKIASYVSDRLRSKPESILLFAWHQEVCDLLSEKLQAFNPGLVRGGVSSDERGQIFKEFQAGQRRLIIGNIAAMGRGHNLQKAGRVVFGEFSWSDELNKQCEGRTIRRGNDAPAIPCDYLVAPNSMDEPLLNAVFTKQKRVKRIIG